MSLLTHLEPLVAAKSPTGVVRCSADEVRTALGFDLAAMRRDGFDPTIVEEHEKLNAVLDSFLSHPVIDQYLTSLTPREVYAASGVRVLPLEDIRREISQGSAPGGYIFPHGCLVFACSVGGNTICLSSQGDVVWADHNSFTDDLITYKDRASGEWHELPFEPKNIEIAVVKLSDDVPAFLADLLQDKLEERLDSLD